MLTVAAFEGQYRRGEESFDRVVRKRRSAYLPGRVATHPQAIDLCFKSFIETFEVTQRKMRRLQDATSKMPKKRCLFGKLVQYG